MNARSYKIRRHPLPCYYLDMNNRFTCRLATLLLMFLFGMNHAFGAGTAYFLNLDGALGVATAEYIIGGIEEAEDAGANVIVIRMDTPGGLMEPMRDIVQAILGSTVPVATYVSPDGARADSAGTYILLASHIAAMAPTTHLGAATPVSLTGEDPGDAGEDDISNPNSARDTEEDSDEADSNGNTPSEDASNGEEDAPDSAMGRKVLNDAIAYIRGLAEAHGRNADWAEEAVRSAATLTANEALELNVIDFIAANQTELLQKMHGREIQLNNETATIDAESLTVKNVEPTWRLKFLNTIASPEITILLLMAGLYGLMFEGYNPGAIIPGVVGVICLLLAAYALQVLPVNYAGLALIIVGLLLVTAEAFVPSFGALGLGGVVAIVFGSIMMFDSGIPGFGISLSFVITFAVIAGLFLFWLVQLQLRLARRGAVSGRESIIGGIGTATESFTGSGHIWMDSESWSARSSSSIEKGQEVRVTAMDGLVLLVEPVSPADANKG